MNTQRIPRVYNIVLNGVLLALVAVLLVFAVIQVRTKLLQNAQDLGMALAHSFAVEEEINIGMLETHLEVAAAYVNEAAAGGDFDGVQSWLSDHFRKLTGIIGEGIVDIYAVVDGRIVAANPWEGDDSYAYAQTDWYRQALEAEGATVRGEAYIDAVTGQLVFTISQALQEPGDVLAMDVYVQNEALHNNAQSLPDNCSYYLCDQSGTLLYAATQWQATQEKLQSYADYMLAGIADGSLLAYDASFRDGDGVSRGVYYQHMGNGWTVMLTIPMRDILMGEQNALIFSVAGVALVLFLALAFMTVQDFLRSRKMKEADDTAHMLGDSFYAIYRVNFRSGSYKALKMHDTLKGVLPPSGDYARLVETMSSLVRPSTFQAFESSFSLDSIRQRADQGISDHGGDFLRKFGDRYRWVNIRTLYNPKLAPNEVILCFRDVDEEKRRELQNTILLQDALDAAEKSTRAKSEFFRSMSHDMRTPLNAIIGCCELAEKSCGEHSYDKAKEYLQKIAFSGRQLLGLINDILELSRLEAGKSNLEERELDLRRLLTDVADIFRDRAREEGKSLEVSLDFQDDLVLGDEKKLTQIINNLLSNAVKYTNPGDRIWLEGRQFPFQQHSSYQIVVEDTGIGMSADFLEHLFDPYSRETAFTSQSVTGTGLGMTIVKSLAQQMSGEISVESELGWGTRFVVTLPFRSAHGTEKAAGKPEEPESGGESFRWTGRRILVAEDNELNLEIVTAMLNQLGAEVLPARDGEEALRVFQAQPVYSVDAILMDMQMPKVDGCQAAVGIRRLERADARSVPIIAVTANAFAEDIDRTTAAGMDGHISKPVDRTVLCQTMEKLILEREARQSRNRAEKTAETGD